MVASMQDVFEYSVFVFCILYVLCGLCVTYFCVIYAVFCVSYVLCFWVICAVCLCAALCSAKTTHPSPT